MKPLDRDDPRYTAYVLGELDGSELAQLESELADNPAAQEYVTELRATTDWLASELSSADGPGLSDAQRAAIAEAALDVPAEAAAEAEASSNVATVTSLRPKRRYGWLAGAGSLAAAAVVLFLFWPGSQKKKAADYRPTQAGGASEAGKVGGKPDPIVLDPSSPTGTAAGNVVSATDSTAAVAATTAPVAAGAGGDGRYLGPRPQVVAGLTGTKTANKPADGYYGYRVGDVGGSEHTQLALTTVPMAARTVTEGLKNDANRMNKGMRIAKEEDSDGDGLGLGLTDSDLIPEKTTEAYDHIVHNPFVAVADDPRSTFSIDVDTAAYANMRRYLNNGARPPMGAVRIEELVNYFSYRYEGPRDTGKPFAVHVEMAPAPWNQAHKLMKIGIKGKEVSGERPRANLVFLLDVSGSMEQHNKLPLLRRALGMLVERLGPEDRVAIVVYAGASGLVLPSTAIADKHRIQSALERLQAGGSTNGGAGIELAYKVAAQNYVKGGVNRVILATDGDFNVGTTNRSALTRLIEKKAKSGVFLTVLGFGMGNYKDATLEQIADHGNGNYAYIDTINEARKVLVEEVSSTLVTIAKDVKLQLEFNPLKVASFRLIGYENRVLAHQDFNDDKKDAGDIGAGHTVTALYEIVPANAGTGAARPQVDALKYQRTTTPSEQAHSDELLTLKLRYKAPDGDRSELSEWPVLDRQTSMREASGDFAFAAAVAAFGMILRDSPHRGQASIGMVQDLATRGAAVDSFGYRAEFLTLVQRAEKLGVR